MGNSEEENTETAVIIYTSFIRNKVKFIFMKFSM